MKNRRSQFVILVIVVLLGVVAAKYLFNSKAKSPFKDECYSSFEDFAYTVPDDTKYETRRAPIPPWEVESEVPDFRLGGSFDLLLSVAATRLGEDYTEVWVKQYPLANFYQDKLANYYQFFVYRTDTKEWKSVPAQVEGTDIYVTQIFVTHDGQLWGKNIWEFNYSSESEERPILSKYNELNGRFEPVESTRSIPNGVLDTNPLTADLPVWTETFLDSNDLFWFVVQRDAIYSFDPATSEVTRRTDLKGVYLKEAILASNGTIYIRRYPSNPANLNFSFSLEKGEFMQYDPAKDQVETVDGPNGYWPTIGNLWADHSNRLWIGAVGFRDSEGKWNRIHPHPWLYMINVSTGNFRWGSPAKIVLESSDGRLWFKRAIDEDRNWGMAWLDPNTMQGCWFTSEYTDIKEDTNHTLWMVADWSVPNKKLYKYEIKK